MSRTTTDAALTTRAAREKLEARHDPYWRGVEGGLALGYRKGPLGGVWLARNRVSGVYRKTTLGRADDVVAATVARGEALGHHEAAKVLDFRQAQAAATAWANQLHRVDAGLEPVAATTPPKPYSVADALADYLADYAARGGKALRQANNAINAHILPTFGSELVARLTRDRVKKWHRSLATAPARLRSTKAKINTRTPDADDDDAPRRRRATANRILTTLKAALNFARHEAKVSCSDDAWAMVPPFKEADAPKIRYLTEEETTRLINACSGDTRDIVLAALLTGCRYGELMKMKAGDLDRQAGTLLIPVAKGKASRHVVLTDEGRAFFDALTTIRPVPPRMLMRDRITKHATKETPAETARVAWKPGDQNRPIKEACAAANIVPAISFHVLRHTHATRLAMRAVPMAVIASQLGHKGTRMTERHYAHLAPSYVADVVRASFGTLGIAADPGSNVTHFQPKSWVPNKR